MKKICFKKDLNILFLGVLFLLIVGIIPISNSLFSISSESSIVEVNSAAHLNENKSFVSDIYDYVKTRDKNWSESINSGEYVRVKFERNLTSVNDIIIYARSNGTSEVEVYEKDGNEVIAKFENVDVDKKYRVYLNNLIGEQDTFDLKILNNSVEFDFIIDPDSFYATGGDVTYDSGYTIHTFTTDGTFEVVSGSVETQVEVLVIGGGGGGEASPLNGGGGGGQVVENTAFSVSVGQYSVTIGLGGEVGSDGGDSVFSSITASGGKTGGNSGSSNAGGLNYHDEETHNGGGGGGDSSVGGGASKESAGNGGSGTASSITGGTYGGGGGGRGGGLVPGSTGLGSDGGADGGSSGTYGGGGGGGYTSASGSTGGNGVVIIRYATDATAPTLDPVAITSNNADTTLAKAGDTVTISFTASEVLNAIPTVTIDGKSADAVNDLGSNQYTATRLMQEGDTEGAITFTIDFTDLTSNGGTQVTSTTDSSSVTFDGIAPTLNPVTIASNNANTTLAKAGDTVTISFTASEVLNGIPTVTINGNSADSVNDLGSNQYTATRVMQEGDTEDAITFTIDFTDLIGNTGTQVTSTTDSSSVSFDGTLPTLGDISYTPNVANFIDPLEEVFINISVVDDQSGIQSVILQVYDEVSWVNYTMTNESDIYSGNFTLQENQTNYTFNIFAIDLAGNSLVSDNISLESYWDCTWNVTTTGSGKDFGSIGGYDEDLNIGNVTIINNGDSNYSGGCNIDFTFAYSSGVILYPDFSINYLLAVQDTLDNSVVQGFKINSSSLPYSGLVLSAGENGTYLVYAGFPRASSILDENPILKLTSNITDTIYNRVTENLTANIIVTPGAYLENAIESPTQDPYVIELIPGNHSFVAYVQDVVSGGVNANNTAYNVSFNWTIPSAISGLFSGNFTNESEVLNNTNKVYLNLSLILDSSNIAALTQTNYVIYTYAYGYENSTGNLSLINHAMGTLLNDSISIRFYCPTYVLGMVTADVCKPVTTTTTEGTSSSGGGGGGGGGAGGSFDKSSATFELIRGDNQEFDLVLENKLTSLKKDIMVSVSGENSEYVSFSPKIIDVLNGQSSTTIKVKITAPSYFGAGQYLLKFTFKGEIVGNSTTAFTEDKYVTLRILDVSREKVNGSLASMTGYISEMNASGFIISDVEELYSQMLVDYEATNFAEVQNLFEQAKKIYEASFESSKMIEEIKEMVEKAETNGLVVSETKKLLYLSEILFKRGDYVLALDKLKEAQLTYALETKGEFNIISAIKNNPGTSTGILLSVLLIGIGSGYVFRLRLLKRRLKYLAEEEQLLLQLMKVVQRDCFENNKMSMEEYQEAMMQYEKGLNNVVADRIRTESLISNLMKLKGKRNALQQERDRLTMLVKQTQEDYLNRGKIDTRVYDNMLKTYAIRLSKIQEELVFMEAKDEIARVKNGVWYRIVKFFGKNK